MNLEQNMVNECLTTQVVTTDEVDKNIEFSMREIIIIKKK